MKRSILLLLAAGLLPATIALAASDTPVGTWKTIDDETGKAKAIVEISAENGALQGKVIEVLQSDQGDNPVCKECEGERHNQPVEGMTILWGLERDGDQWEGGHILDPNNGKIYKAKMELTDNGESLKVRGYIGFSLLGRTQVWQRAEPPAPPPAPASAPATGMSAATPAAATSIAPQAEPAAAGSVQAADSTGSEPR